jgi:tRNA threonylcarbamoyladenosine biosynthesis protein TsaE
MRKTQTASLSQIETLAEQISLELKGGEVLALVGQLGAGKTTFAQSLGKRLKVKQRMSSPTFTLMHAFPARLKNGQPVVLFHLDLYRTKGFAEVKNLGLQEFMGKKGTITLIEWADKIKRHLPKKTYVIKFKN